MRTNERLVTALYNLLENEERHEIIDPVCHQLFEFYRSKHADLQYFTMELLPTLIWVYLRAVSRNNKKSCGGIEACLLGIYNLETVNPDGSPKEKTFTIPTLSKPSIYHEPVSLAALALTETALNRYGQGEVQVISQGPVPQAERINAQNRFSILTHLLSLYNAEISYFSSKSHMTLCLLASRVAKTGFDDLLSTGNTTPLPQERRELQLFPEPRITLSPTFLLEMLSGLYFIMFNSHPELGRAGMEDIHARAMYELYADVLLVCNAIRNSLQYNPSGQPQDGPIGISIALSPSTTTSSISKAAITNASFKTKKLPDDITIDVDDIDVTTTEDEDEKTKDHAGLEKRPSIREKSMHVFQPLISPFRKSDKSKKKEGKDLRDSIDNPSPRSSRSSSIREDWDVADGAKTSVSVVKGQNAVVVDTIEMNSLPKSDKKKGTSDTDELVPDQNGSSNHTEIPTNNVKEKTPYGTTV